MEFVFVLLYIACVALVLLFFRGVRVLNGDDESASPPPLIVKDLDSLSEDERQLPLPIGR